MVFARDWFSSRLSVCSSPHLAKPFPVICKQARNSDKMNINKKFNELKFSEYFPIIENHKNYSDFNTLGLFRSLLENENLNINEKIEIRDFANKFFEKTFNFLQIKDPLTYFNVKTIGENLTKGDEENLWRIIIENQRKILADKKIKHRNFGEYSKHNCGYDDCIWNGLMIKQGSRLAESNMHFKEDKSKYQQKLKSERRKSDRKNEGKIIREDIKNE